MGLKYYIRLSGPIILINIASLVLLPIINIPMFVIGFCIIPIDILWIGIVILLMLNDNNYKKGE